MHKHARVILVLMAAALIFPGCMTFEVSGNASITEDSTNGHQTVHGSMYKIPWSDYHVQKCDETALARVEFHFNGLQMLSSVLSLGLYVPQTVEWWCDDPSTKDDEKEAEPDPHNEFSARPMSRTEGLGQ